MNETVGCRSDVYTDIGVGAVRGEAEKRQSRDEALLRRAEFALWVHFGHFSDFPWLQP